MSERRPETTGRRSAGALMILSVLLLAGAGGLLWLHVSGRLQPIVAASPSIEVELPASVSTGGLEMPPEPEAAEGPAAVAELTPPSAETPAEAPGTPAEPAEAPIDGGAVEPRRAAPVPSEPAPEPPAPASAEPATEPPAVATVEPPANEPLAAEPPTGTTAAPAPSQAVPPSAETSQEDAGGTDQQTEAPVPGTPADAGATGGADTGHEDAAAEAAAAELAAQASDEPPPPAPPVPELPAEPAPETAAQHGTAAETGQESGEVGEEAGAPAAAAPEAGPAENPQVAAAIVPPGTVPAWQRLARPFPPDETRPRIAVVVAGLGLSDAATTAAIQQLPAEITLSFSPYSNRIEEWVAMARAAGHEVLIDLPMEPASFPRDDPGPQALLTSLGEQSNAERLAWSLSRTEGFLGVATFMGSRFTTSPEHLRPVLAELARRGLMILDSRSATDSLTASLAAEEGVAHAINDRFLDHEASRVAIDGRLQQIERIARTKGVAVAMGYAYPVTVERLREWVRGLAGKGLTLAPISAVADRQEVR